MHVCFLQCGRSLRANGCDVIARKFMALDDHLVLLLPKFCAGSNQPKRDCLTAQSPGPPNSARQISFDLLFEIACSSLILISETGGQVIVSQSKIFAFQRDAWFPFYLTHRCGLASQMTGLQSEIERHGMRVVVL